MGAVRRKSTGGGRRWRGMGEEETRERTQVILSNPYHFLSFPSPAFAFFPSLPPPGCSSLTQSTLSILIPNPPLPGE